MLFSGDAEDEAAALAAAGVRPKLREELQEGVPRTRVQSARGSHVMLQVTKTKIRSQGYKNQGSSARSAKIKNGGKCGQKQKCH